MTSETVQGKRNPAKKWFSYVNTSPSFRPGPKWNYVLLSEADVRDAIGSWAALRGLSTPSRAASTFDACITGGPYV